MKNQNFSKYTIESTNKHLIRISKKADLNKPEQVTEYIANLENISNGTKKQLCLSYNRYCKYYKIDFERPKYKQETKLRRIPTTENLNMLIAKARRTISTQMTISKETGLRPIELCTLKVKDIDLDHKTIYPTTAKNGAPRKLKISNRLTLMIQNHINTKKLNPNDKLFKGDAANYGKNYRQMRNNLANKLNNHTLKTIRLYDFRHYFATRLYAKTRDILYVKQQMGHKSIDTTLIYTQLIDNNEEEEYTCKTANNSKEAIQLIETGFKYEMEIDGLKLFKKRK